MVHRLSLSLCLYFRNSELIITGRFYRLRGYYREHETLSTILFRNWLFPPTLATFSVIWPQRTAWYAVTKIELWQRIIQLQQFHCHCFRAKIRLYGENVLSSLLPSAWPRIFGLCTRRTSQHGCFNALMRFNGKLATVPSWQDDGDRDYNSVTLKTRQWRGNVAVLSQTPCGLRPA